MKKVLLKVLGVSLIGLTMFGCNGNENKTTTIQESLSKIEQKDKTKVKLVEFLDPECPACAPFHQYLKRHLDEKYVDIEYKYLEIHANSKLLIHILEASKKQGKYKELLDYMYSNQEKFTDYKTKDNIKIWNFISENNMNLDISKLKLDMKDIDIDLILKKDFDDAKNLKVEGTPTLFINGIIQNNKSIGEIMDEIDLSIAKVKE